MTWVQEKYKALFTNGIIPVTLEMMRLFPDGLVIASGLYALITLSYPFMVFFGSMLEVTVIFRLIQWFSTYVTANPNPASTGLTNTCRSGFTQPSATLTMLSLFGNEPINTPFPSAPIFMLAAASSYIFSTLNNQSKELQALGPAYSARYYVSATFLLLLLGIFCAFRMGFSCDTFGVVMFTLPIGLILGIAIVQQNIRLFGDASVNLLGIPLLRNRAANGKNIYVCPK